MEEHYGKPAEILDSGFVIAGRYEIVRRLGAGGMGSVYLGRDRVLASESVAIKVLHPEFSRDPVQMQRFLREVQIMRKLNHPNVVRTFDVGNDGDMVYFTMEYLCGGSFDCLMSKKAFPLEKLSSVIIEICSGLQAIHAEGIIHRDIKPANLVLLDTGLTKIMDFGVARTFDSKLTAHNEMVGSASYMAPEIWLARDLTGAVDLYALGIILYEMATDELPFEGHSAAELMRLHLDREPDPPRKLNPKCPAWLDRLIVRLMAKRVRERFQSAREVIEYVERYNEGAALESAGTNPSNIISTDFIRSLEALSQDTIKSRNCSNDKESSALDSSGSDFAKSHSEDLLLNSSFVRMPALSGMITGAHSPKRTLYDLKLATRFSSSAKEVGLSVRYLLVFLAVWIPVVLVGFLLIQRLGLNLDRGEAGALQSGYLGISRMIFSMFSIEIVLLTPLLTAVAAFRSTRLILRTLFVATTLLTLLYFTIFVSAVYPELSKSSSLSGVITGSDLLLRGSVYAFSYLASIVTLVPDNPAKSLMTALNLPANTFLYSNNVYYLSLGIYLMLVMYAILGGLRILKLRAYNIVGFMLFSLLLIFAGEVHYFEFDFSSSESMLNGLILYPLQHLQFSVLNWLLILSFVLGAIFFSKKGRA